MIDMMKKIESAVPEWALAFKAEHGVWPIAGGSDTSTVPNGVTTDPDSGFPTANNTPNVQQPPADPEPPAPQQQQRELPPRDDKGRFTAEDVERIRKEEKDKLYDRLNGMEEEVRRLREEREARERSEQEAREAAEAAAKKAREEEMSFKELLEAKEQEFRAEIARLENERTQERQILEMERQYQALEAYKAQRLAEPEVSENLLPELRDLVSGTSTEEIDASIAMLVDRSSVILNNTMQVQQGLRAAQPGASVTAPPVGPVEQNDTAYETFTEADLRGMDMATYMKNRDKLLPAASAQRNRGMFG